VHSVRKMHFTDLEHLASVRAFAARAADELGSSVDRGELAVVVGELAANAVVHQHGDAEIEIRGNENGGLEVSVHDDDPAMPALMESEPWDRDGHRGLLIVRALSEAWGVAPDGDGKRVWARLAPADLS
jgi:anti-sigma regulatory factor (Ser/Thr protein kinase)